MISLAGLGAAPRAYQSGLDDNLALLQKQQQQQALTAYGNALPGAMGMQQPSGPGGQGGMPPMNPSQYDSLFAQAGAKYGVPEQLLKAVAKQESSFNPSAKSPAGAAGLMQFMPQTAQRFGVDSLNPASSVDGAARYLKTLYDQFGDWKLALAGYNWGEGNVGKWLQSGADPNAMPPETRNYIANLAPVAEQATGMVQGGAGGGAGMLAPGMMSPQPMAQQGGMQPPQPGMSSPQLPGPPQQQFMPGPPLTGKPIDRMARTSSQQMGGMAQPGMAPPPGAATGAPMVLNGAQGESPMAQLPRSMAGTLDWRSLINVIQERNPGIAPEVLALTVDRFAPYMEDQSAREWEQVKQQQGFDQQRALQEDQQAFLTEQNRYKSMGGNAVFDTQTGEIIRGPGAGLAGGKPLTNPIEKEIAAAGSGLVDMNRSTENWQPEYGGYPPLTGDIAMWAARHGAGNRDAANWWQDYDRQKNVLRHDLFGSALTQTEKAQWEAADVNPSMTPDLIATNLQRQQDAALRAARKLAGSWSASGYDRTAIEQALGIPMSELGIGEDGLAPLGSLQGQGGGDDTDAILQEANDAIAGGADRDAIMKELKETYGLDMELAP